MSINVGAVVAAIELISVVVVAVGSAYLVVPAAISAWRFLWRAL